MSSKPTVIQRLKGTQDILPKEVTTWQWLEQTVSHTLHQWSYREIRTPVLEMTSLFARGVGEGTDIVSKEMFSFERSGRQLCLRPEGTAGVVRSYIEQGLSNELKPVRLWYKGPMFRYERPQEGRQRQFHQLGVEVFGVDTPQTDAEVIALSAELFKQLGVLPNVRLLVNTIGEPEERVAFKAALQKVLQPYLPELCEDCQRRYESNPLRMLDCKVPTCKAIYEGSSAQDFLQGYVWGEASTLAFEQTLSLLDALNLPYTKEPKLVRGLDYYNRTVFEWQTDLLGAQGAVCGGGRYNGLVSTLGGSPTAAVGFGIGLERLVKLCSAPEQQPLAVYIVSELASFGAAMTLASELRATGLQVELDVSGKAFGKQLQAANKRGANVALLLGASELETNQVQVKHLATGQQVTCTLKAEAVLETL